MVEDAPRRAPLRVAIAEDSGLLRAGIARLITDAGHRVIAEASDGPGFLKVIGEQRPDVAVVDVRMPPGFKDEGLKAALEARRRIPGLPVLVLSQYVEERYGRDLLESGMEGTGYLLKDRVADLQRHFGMANADLEKLGISADRVTKRGLRIESLDLTEPATPAEAPKPRLVERG